MKFAIISLSRTGSTAVYRALRAAGLNVRYEPDFSVTNLDPAAIHQMCLSLRDAHDGIKHVWDPNGWPFRNRWHRSSLETLGGAEDLVAPNQLFANGFDRVVVLRRQDMFHRTLSDLLGQQSGLWGHNADGFNAATDADQYRHQAQSQALAPLDADVVAWYVHHGFRLEDSIIAGIAPDRLKVFYHEVLFDHARQRDVNFSAWTELAAWIGASLDVADPRFLDIVSPVSKLNGLEILSRIPNYLELREKFGSSPISP